MAGVDMSPSGAAPLVSTPRSPASAAAATASPGWRCTRGRLTLPPLLLLALFSAVNIINYVDRGIVPGAFASLGEFVRQDGGGGVSNGNSTDTQIGILQSAFVVGYSGASLGFGHAAHSHPPFKLMVIGLAIWCGAVMLSALSPHYWVLLLARALSGVGEASFQCVVPPVIEDRAPPAQKGLYLSAFYVAIPVGTALGFAIGGSVPWRWAFGGEAIPMLLLLPLLWFLDDGKGAAAAAAAAAETDALRAVTAVARGETPLLGNGDGSGRGDKPARPRFLVELIACLCDPTYMFAVLGYAGFTAVIAGLGSFGPTMTQGMGLMACQSTASLSFGATICAAGLLGTPLGGWWLDHSLHRLRAKEAMLQGGATAVTGPAVAGPVTSPSNDDAATSRNKPLGGAELDNEASSQGSSGAYFVPMSPLQGSDIASTPPLPGEVAVPLPDAVECSVQLRVALRQSTVLVALGTCVVFAAAAATASGGPAPFFCLMVVGCALLFANTAAVNLSLMAAAPGGRAGRPFAIGLGTLLMHALGDVPSPPIIGDIAASLSPVSNCPAVAEDCFSCTRSGSGLRQTLFLVLAWLLWPVALWGAAWALSLRRRGGMGLQVL